MNYEDVRAGDIISITSRYSAYLNINGKVLRVVDDEQGLGFILDGPLRTTFYDTLWELTRIVNTKRPEVGAEVRFYTEDDIPVVGHYKDGRFVGYNGDLERVDIPYDEVVSWTYIPSEGVL